MLQLILAKANWPREALPYSCCNKHLPLIWFSILCDLIFHQRACTTAFVLVHSSCIYSLMFIPSFKKFCSKQASFTGMDRYLRALFFRNSVKMVFTRGPWAMSYISCAAPAHLQRAAANYLSNFTQDLKSFAKLRSNTKFWVIVIWKLF